jgi:hypothetical protein
LTTTVRIKKEQPSCFSSLNFLSNLSFSYEQEGFKLQLDDNETKTFDRIPLYCVPIPAETQWAKDIVFYSHSFTFQISFLWVNIELPLTWDCLFFF